MLKKIVIGVIAVVIVVSLLPVIFESVSVLPPETPTVVTTVSTTLVPIVLILFIVVWLVKDFDFDKITNRKN